MPSLMLTAAVILLFGGFAYLAYRGSRNRRGEPGAGDNSGSGSESYAAWGASDSATSDTFTAGGGDFGGGGASGGWDDGGSDGGGDSGDSGGEDSGGGDSGGGSSD